MKKFILSIILLHTTLTAGIPLQEEYYGPTEQLIKRESWSRIEKKMKKLKITSKLFSLFNSIASEEDWGHIGYHGANHGFRVYQDVIRLTIEEILGLPVREDFHFLRIPGDRDLNLNTVQEFYDYWGKNIDNKSKTRAKQLLSLNYGIYSNYDSEGSFSLYLFVKDKSKTSVKYVEQLTPFYQDLGISSKALKELFAIGEKWLDQDGGILLRLYEDSHLFDLNDEAYNFADEQCYPCKRGGYLYGKREISNHYERIMTDLYINGNLSISPQLRLLINNEYTLNPLSHLHIKRWDLYDSKTVTSYEKEMREYIRKLRFDEKKVEKYRDLLLNLWQEPSLCN